MPTKNSDASDIINLSSDLSEQELLGVLLIRPELDSEVSSFLKPEHFANPVNGAIYEALIKLLQKQTTVTLSQLSVALHDHKDNLQLQGGIIQYLSNMAKNAVLCNNPLELANLIKNLYVRRQILHTLNASIATFTQDDVQDICSEVEKLDNSIFQILNSDKNFYPKHITHSLKESLRLLHEINDTDNLPYTPTGFADLDDKIAGLYRNELTVVGARTAMGKTAFLLSIALNIAKRGIGVVFFSLEMSAEQLLLRLLSKCTKIPLFYFRTGKINKKHLEEEVPEAIQSLSDLPMYIEDSPNMTIEDIISKSKLMCRMYNVKVILVDYLQLVKTTTKNTNRATQVDDIAVGLRHIARNNAMSVVAAAQLSRSLENRENKRPILADLRESGGIEQTADNAICLHRPEVYLERQEPKDKNSEEYEKWKNEMELLQGIVEVSINKNRQGPTGMIKLKFNGETVHFRNLE